MAGLGGGMDEQGGLELGEHFLHGRAIADVEFVVLKILVRGQQPTLVPASIATRAEEVRPHVIVHAVNLPPQTAKVGHHFRTNQTR